MIKIKENNEPLVLVEKYAPEIKITLAGNKKAYLRKTVAEMLNNAQKSLPDGISFILNDAWRPVEEQLSIRQGFEERFKKMYPNWNDKRIMEEVNNYAAQTDGEFFSGHLAGAAIDIRLIKNGRKIPMKSKRLSYQENALSDQPKLPKYIQKNRKILSGLLIKVGFSNYPKEYWHWSYGDWQWAKRAGKSEAFYGIAKLNDK